MANLGTIIQGVMDRIDAPDLQASGKYSLAWYTRLINRAQAVLARRVGYKQGRIPVSVAANTQVSAWPTSLCWGIIGVQIGTNRLDAKTPRDMDDDVTGWRYQSSFPNQPANDGIEVVSSSTSDATQKLTIYGSTYATGAYASEQITVNGTTQVATSKTDWGEVYYAVLDGVCAGTITIREASGNATIATIAAGELTAGEAISTGVPTTYIISPPSTIEWYPVPNAAYTAWLRGGLYPTEFTTPASIEAAITTADSLPVEFYDVLADGAAALSETTDLYEETNIGRMNEYKQAFLSGAEELNAYLNSMQHDRESAMRFGI